jgi:Lipoprotein LpqB beta-propeller domain/Sporulation and spore germination
MTDHLAEQAKPPGRAAGGRPDGRPDAATASRFARVAALAAAVALAACGCAMVPAGGSVHTQAIPTVGTGQDNPQLIPVGPVPGGNQVAIVSGFLAANASFANDPAVAREYLTPAERNSWHPDGAVTVVGNLQKSPTTSFPKRQVSLPSDQQTAVQVTGVQQATLTGSGQYLTSSSADSPRITYEFRLIKINNQWRIDHLCEVGSTPRTCTPTSQLLLTTDELERAYQQRNLYFLDPTRQTLVPDPVFVPQNDTTSDLATELVKGLFKNPQGWLSGAAQTAFPAGTRPIGQVKINGPVATVNLGMPANAARSVDQLAAQLVWTLTSNSFGPSAIESVELQINGKTLSLNRSQYQLPKFYQTWASQAQPAGPYFVSQNGPVREVTVTGTAQAGAAGPVPTTSVLGQAGTLAAPALGTVAVAPSQAELAGISADGQTVFTGPLAGNAVLTPKRPGGTCTSLSWDRNGDLWVAAGSSVWMLTPGTGSTVQVDLGLPAGAEVTAIRVAPDGVRVAMIVKKRDGSSQILLAAITHADNGATPSIGQTVAIGAGISDPEALTWYDADHVVVLEQTAARPQLMAIPLDGSQPTPIPTLTGTVSVTANGTGLAVGLSDGRLDVSPGLNGLWRQVAGAGAGPAYPG